jgi:hypothetical protein
LRSATFRISVRAASAGLVFVLVAVVAVAAFKQLAASKKANGVKGLEFQRSRKG